MYRFQIRMLSQQSKRLPLLRPLIPAFSFDGKDDDDVDVEKEFLRHVIRIRNNSLKEAEEVHKKAIEQDPFVFDYDAVYDEMKQKRSRPKSQDGEERKPRYIPAMIEKAKQRRLEHETVYERKLATERSKDDHLYADKYKFVTSSYKRKLAERAKWMEEEQVREQKDDVTKKTNLSELYSTLVKNVAFGTKLVESTESSDPLESAPSNTVPSSSSYKAAAEQPSTDPSKRDHQSSKDALSAAKERFLARKKARIQ